jgi:hypothetical protein
MVKLVNIELSPEVGALLEKAAQSRSQDISPVAALARKLLTSAALQKKPTLH